MARAPSLAPLVGPLPAFLAVTTRAQLFMFSAVTWNRHHIHYDRDAARSEGHRDVVVHRALLGNLLARQLERAFADRVIVRTLSWRVLASAYVGEPLHCQGEAVLEQSADGPFLRVVLRISREDGQALVAGQALCHAPSRNEEEVAHAR